jgi:hypothetical protein
MPQLAIAAVGAAIGHATIAGTVLGMSGAAIGWTLGSVAGSLLFQPDSPGATMQDTRAAKLQYGARIPRPVGRVRLPLNPRWTSEWRETGQEAGGKGGGGSEYFTYSADGLFWVADATQQIKLIALTRLWHNGKLVWTKLADSSDESLANSEAASLFSEVEFHDGNAAQMPWAVYEAAVGSVNADAHRRIACVSVTNYQAGTSPNWGLLEGEFITAGTHGATGALTRLQCHFTGADSTDISYYEQGPSSTPPFYASIVDGAYHVDTGGNADPESCKAEWTSSELGGAYGGPVMFEALVTITEMAGISFFPIITWYTGTGDHYDIGIKGTGGGPATATIVYNDHGFGIEADSGVPALGEHHLCVQIGPSGLVAFVDGVPFHTIPGDQTVVTGPTGTVYLGSENAFSAGGYDVILDVHAFRFRGEEVYDLDGFTPPTELDPPDFPLDYWTPEPEDLEDVCDSEMARCRRVSGWYDNSELAGIEVAGAVFNSSAKDSLEQMAAAYYFGATCRDQLITRLRGSASVATIAYADSGAGVDNAGEPFTGVECPDDLEVPAYFNVTSPDVQADFDAGTETSDRMITNGTEVRQVQLIAVLTAAERKGRANALSMDAWVGSHSANLAVDDTQAKLEPCDVLTATDEEGNTYRVRIVRENYASGVKSLDVVLDDASALPTTGITAAPFEPTISVAAPGESALILLDIPILQDADNAPGIYAAISGTGEWPGATLYRSTDGVSYAAVGAVTRSATVGTVTALADYTGWTWDEDSSITVTLANTEHTLTSSTHAVMEADETVNAAAIGADGRWELLRFRVATFVEAGVYTLSGFLRGQRGTEHNNSLHEAADIFVLLANNGIVRVAHDASSIGATRYYKAVTAGALVSAADEETQIDTGVALMPYAPVDLIDTGGTYEWHRRSRLSAPPIYADPPLGETTESYDVELLDSGDVVLEEDTVSTPSWTPAGAGDKVRVYQKSEIVGRGYVAELEL